MPHHTGVRMAKMVKKMYQSKKCTVLHYRRTYFVRLSIETIKGVGLETSGDDVTNYVQIQRKAAILFDLIAATV